MINPKDTAFLEIASSKIKRKILQNLATEPLQISELANKNNYSKSALQAHINKLENNGLIYKQKNGVFYNTDLAKIFLLQFSNFDFLKKNQKFFEDHDFGDIPSNLKKSLALLRTAELVRGLTPNFTRWRHLIDNAKKYVYCIFTQPPILIANPILEKISEGLEFRILLGQNSIINYNNEFVEKLELRKLQPYSTFEKRMAKTVFVNMLISEREVCLMFPFKDGETDIQNNFVSNEKDFHNWSLDFFNFKWESSEPFARLRESF